MNNNISNTLLESLPDELKQVISHEEQMFEKYLLSYPSSEEIKWIAKKVGSAMTTKIIEGGECTSKCYVDTKIIYLRTVEPNGKMSEASKMHFAYSLSDAPSFDMERLRDAYRKVHLPAIFDVKTMYLLARRRSEGKISVAVLRKLVLKFLYKTAEELKYNKYYPHQYLHASCVHLQILPPDIPTKDTSIPEMDVLLKMLEGEIKMME